MTLDSKYTALFLPCEHVFMCYRGCFWPLLRAFLEDGTGNGETCSAQSVAGKNHSGCQDIAISELRENNQILELRENNQILEFCENNRVLVVLTKLDFWSFGLENGLEGQF